MSIQKIGSGVKIYEVDSESELKALCNENILGLDTENKKKFYLVKIQRDNLEVAFGLLNGGHGIDPSVILNKKTDVAIISSDKSVYIFDLNGSNIVHQVLCESFVYDIVLAQRNFLIICELEVRCLSSKGLQIWRYDSDLISDYKLYENHLEIITEDGHVKISLQDGHLV